MSARIVRRGVSRGVHPFRPCAPGWAGGSTVRATLSSIRSWMGGCTERASLPSIRPSIGGLSSLYSTESCVGVGVVVAPGLSQGLSTGPHRPVRVCAHVKVCEGSERSEGPWEATMSPRGPRSSVWVCACASRRSVYVCRALSRL